MPWPPGLYDNQLASHVVVTGLGGSIAMNLWAFLGGISHAGPEPFQTGWGYEWLSSNWMFVHGAWGAVVLVQCVLSMTAKSKTDPLWMSITMSALYTLHQWEEHAWDVFGRRYPFIHHLCHILGSDNISVTYSPNIVVSGCPADQEILLWINVYGCFLFLHMPFALPKPYRVHATIATLMLVAGNAALFHCLPAILSGTYNPGLIQSIVLNLPFSIWCIYQLVVANQIPVKDLAVAFLLTCVPGQPILLLGPMVLFVNGYVSKWALHLILMASTSLVPVFFAFLMVKLKGKEQKSS